MGIDINTKIIQGFRVPYEKLYKVNQELRFHCDHTFDRTKIKFCPECGKKSNGFFYHYEESIIDIDLDELRDNDGQLTEKLHLQRCTSNCELEEHDKDYVIGIECYNDEPDCPDHMLNYIKPISKDEVLAEIKKYPVNIPYDKDSFGIYLMNEIY